MKNKTKKRQASFYNDSPYGNPEAEQWLDELWYSLSESARSMYHLIPEYKASVIFWAMLLFQADHARKK